MAISLLPLVDHEQIELEIRCVEQEEIVPLLHKLNELSVHRDLLLGFCFNNRKRRPPDHPERVMKFLNNR